MLERVETDGAFAAAALDAELARYPQLDPRERALATELVYGCLRMGGALRQRLAALAPRGIAGGDRRVERELVVAAYQLLALERIPDYAAVDAAVRAISAQRGRSVGGFANAVLRKLAGERGHVDRATLVRESTPPWLRARLTAVVGESEADALLGATRAVDELTLRVVAGRPLPTWIQELAPGQASPRARRVQGVGDPRRLSGWEEGVFVVQEEGAQVVALALGARPGERILDACAGRGQKTSLLREQVGESGQVWATDLHPNKLDALAGELERLRLPAVLTAGVDWTLGSGPVPQGSCDRVLVDAPCSGVGTLRRRPEIARRLEPDDPARLAALARAILCRAAACARVGGRVLFAVCSVLPEECEAVIESVAPELEPAPFDAPELGALLPAGATALRLLPLAHGTDGYFVASFVRRG